MRVAFVSSEQLNDDIMSFSFRPEKPLMYTAGQFIELTIEHMADSRGQRRWFTLSSSPTEGLLTITTRLSDNPSSFKQALRRIAESDLMDMSQPMGDFVLPMDRNIPLLFVVGGIGITPVRSMLKYLTDSNQHRNIHVIYAVRTREDVIFDDELAASGVTIDYVIRKTSDKSTRSQEMSSTIILDAINELPSPLIYLSGPEELVEKLYAELKEQGIKESRLVTDYFQGYGSI